MGNGAKAQQKRERNAKDAKGGASSQLKTVRFPLYTAHVTRPTSPHCFSLQLI